MKSALFRIFIKLDTIRADLFPQNFMNTKERQNIRVGMRVAIVLKQDQRTGKRTIGVVKDLLTNSNFHPHGIKVRLTDGQVGRVQEILMEK
jgi:uncharacterized repeat protein (TIGR03833 family)